MSPISLGSTGFDELVAQRAEDKALSRARITAYNKESVDQVARMHHRNIDAAQALGVSVTGFVKLCRKHGVKTPPERRKK